MPGRFKSFDYYNAGTIIDAVMAIFKPMLSKKMRERVSTVLRIRLCTAVVVIVCQRLLSPNLESKSSANPPPTFLLKFPHFGVRALPPLRVPY